MLHSFRQHLLGTCLLLVLCGMAWAQDIPPRPNPPRLVNDYVGMLNQDEETALEAKLKAYNDSTSTQIVVVIVENTGDYPPSDYAFKLGETWGVGQKGKNNGIVFLWATGTRKIFIATGRGMEGAIPDAIAKRIISNEVVPNFKNQQWFQGISQGVDAIIAYAKGEYKAEKGKPQNNDDDGGMSGIIFLIIFIVVIYLIIRSNRRGGGGNRYRGGGFFPYTTMSSWGSSSGSGWGGGGGFDFGGGSFGGGGAGGDY